MGTDPASVLRAQLPACATIVCVLAFTWLGFFGWLAALFLAIALVLGLLALIAYFGGGQDGLSSLSEWSTCLPDRLERRLRERLDALGPARHAPRCSTS